MIKQSTDMFADESSDSNVIMPDPDYVIKDDDILVLFGSDEKIAQTNNW